MIFFSRTALLDPQIQLNAQQLSTRLSFFGLGFGTAAWAPLIPFAQQRLHLNHADFGLLLLCTGLGAMLAMPATGKLIQKMGCRFIIGGGIALLLTLLPALALWSFLPMMAITLFLFGAAAGALGVAINFQAVFVEKHRARPMMSGFHGMCSLGGLFGVLSVTTLLAIGISPMVSAVTISMLLVLLGLFAIPYAIPAIEEHDSTEQVKKKKLSLKDLPSPLIFLIGIACFIAFLSEGAAMDWSGIYLTSKYAMNPAFAGLGYTFFAVTMTAGRFLGQTILRYLGERRLITLSSILAATGLFTVVLAPHWMLVLVGYALIGLGSSNIVPIMFSRIGRQTKTPKAAALSWVSTIAYTGSLAGPALVGLMGQTFGLSLVFAGLAVMLVLIAGLNRLTLVD